MSLSFSISVPVGAWHPFLPACLASLFAQDGAVRVSLLDASNDPRTAALAERFAPKLAYRRRGPDGGQSDAIIEGWNNAPADILGWLNADDILFPDAIAKARAAFEAGSDLDMVYGHSTILDAGGRMVGYHWAVEPPGPRIFEAGVISQPSCFFRRRIYEAAGGLDRALHYTMDWDLWIRIYKAGAKVGFIDAPLSMVLWGEETKTASFNARRRDELKRLIDAHAPAEKRAKIFRAFALHNLMNRVRPEGLRRTILRVLHRGRREIYGLSADGLVRPGARLFLAHYEDAPQTTIRIRFERGAQGVTARADGARVEPAADGLDLVFDKPVEKARTVEIILETDGSARPRFLGAGWGDAFKV